MHSSDEKTIDLMDFLVELLFRWKFILIVTVAVTVLVAGLDAVRSVRNRGGVSEAEAEIAEEEIQQKKEELIESKRSAITETEAEEVERIYKQYKSYLEQRNFIQDELSSYDQAFNRLREDMLIRRDTYILDSQVEGAETLFTGSGMDLEDYRKVMDIIPEVDNLSAASKYITIGATASNTTEIAKLGESETIRPAQYMFIVEVLGDDQETCDQIWAVVDAAYKRNFKSLKKVDADASLTRITTNYRANVYDYYITREQGTFDIAQRVDTMISNLKAQGIDKLPEDQAAYYKALRDADRSLIEDGVLNLGEVNGEEEAGVDTRLVHPKMLILGILAGLFLACAAALVRYLFSGMINVGQEMQDYYRIPVLDTFFIRSRKGHGLFPGLIRKLLHVDSTEDETKAEMIAEDTCGAVQQAEGDSVYIVRTCRDEADFRVATMIQNAVASHGNGCKAVSGAPLDSVHEMHALTQQKNVLVLVHNKKTVQADVEKLLDLCSRHAIKVLGAVSITEI